MQIVAVPMFRSVFSASIALSLISPAVAGAADRPKQLVIVSFDGAYVAEKTLQGARAFVDQEVAYTMVIGGDDWSALQDFSNRKKLLTSTLYVTDLDPDAKYLLAPVEVHPLYFGCGAEYLRKLQTAIETARRKGASVTGTVMLVDTLPKAP